jgi:hypothetical protein
MVFYKVKEIDFSQIKFSKTNKKTGLRFMTAYYDKKSFGIKLPKLRIPFDSRVNQFGQLEINISLGKEEELQKSLQKLDEEMETFVTENEWFEQGEDYCYVPFVKQSEDFPASIKLKITKKDDMIKTLFYDEEKQKIDVKDYRDVVDLIKKGTCIQSAIECSGVWVSGNKFGLTWKTEQIRIISRPDAPFDFDEDFSDDENHLPTQDTCLIDDD